MFNRDMALPTLNCTLCMQCIGASDELFTAATEQEELLAEFKPTAIMSADADGWEQVLPKRYTEADAAEPATTER